MPTDEKITITFKTKVHSGLTDYLQSPVFTGSHCNMGAWRSHRKYGNYVNSSLFPNVLGRIRRELFGAAGILHLDTLPPGVTVDTSSFLAVVTIDVDAAVEVVL